MLTTLGFDFKLFSIMATHEEHVIPLIETLNELFSAYWKKKKKLKHAQNNNNVTSPTSNKCFAVNPTSSMCVSISFSCITSYNYYLFSSYKMYCIPLSD